MINISTSSTSSEVTAQELENSLFNLAIRSYGAQIILSELARHQTETGATIDLKIVDNIAGGDGARTQYFQTTGNIVIEIEKDAFDGEYYYYNDGNDTDFMSLERYLAEELSHAYLFASGNDGTALEDELRSQNDANEIMADAFGETTSPRADIPADPINNPNTYAGSGLPALVLDPNSYDPNDLNGLEPQAGVPAIIDDEFQEFDAADDTSSPLVIDIDLDGVELTAFNASSTTTFFDLDGDGYAEQTAWVSADDGLLVRDVDANGMIDDVTELFGSPSIDGFAKLALLDSNGDLVIDQYDDAWLELQVWQDANGDAISQSAELLTLASLDIVSIDLANLTIPTSSINGNTISHASTVRYCDDSTSAIVDAWFVNSDVNTIDVTDTTLVTEALFLVYLRGYGELSGLPIAMSADSMLLDLVEDFVTDWNIDRFGAPSALNSDMEAILFRWAGVDGVSATSRGDYIDARKLGFMEKLFGQEYVLNTGAPDPLASQAARLENVWNSLFASFKTHLIVQMSEGMLYDGEVGYNAFSGEVEGQFDLVQAEINDLVTPASASGVDTDVFFQQIAEYIDLTKGLSNVTATEEGWLDTALLNAGSSNDWDDIVASMVTDGFATIDAGTSAAETITGSAGADQLGGSTGYDIIIGGDGDDELLAGSDGGELRGGDGNDTLDGYNGSIAHVFKPGEGGDTVLGSSGNDAYYFEGGNDYYEDTGGSDTIYLGSGITSNDLTFWRANVDSLLIEVGALGNIEIDEYFSSALRKIEEIEFSDATTLDLTALTDFTYHGSEAGDSLVGMNNSDDILYGYAGADTLFGYSGNDILDGGIGNDTLIGGDGDDDFIFSEGFDNIQANGNADTDRLVIREGYTIDDVSFIKEGNNLNIYVENLGQVKVQAHFAGVSSHLEQVYFLEDSSTLDILTTTIEQRGGDNNDNLSGLTSGASADDILNGMGGNDTLQGGAGSDTYVFSEGTDTVYETGGTADRVLFWERWTPSEIEIYQAEAAGWGYDDLVIEDDSGNKMIIESYVDYPSDGGKIETVEFYGGTIWDLSTMQFEIRGTSGNDNIQPGDSSGRIIRGLDGNDYIAGGAGSDTLDGGAGNDNLNGAGGDDTYVYVSGIDTVSETGGQETVAIKSSAHVSDIAFVTSGFSLNLVIDSSVDEIRLQNHLFSTSNEVETLKFADGFELDLTLYGTTEWHELDTSGTPFTGTSSAEVVIGDTAADTIDAGSGTDYVYGGAGDDDLNGQGGSDYVHGDDGADIVHGAGGNDFLWGGAGDDAVRGQNGDDVLYGDAGNDTVYGGNNNDMVYGGDGDDNVKGDAGDDVLYGEDGFDKIWGGTGADRFVLDASAFNDVDRLKDFSEADNDTIDLSAILDGFYDAGTDAITDFVEITDNGTLSTLKVDQDGGGDNFVTIAKIEGVVGLTDELALETAGTLITS